MQNTCLEKPEIRKRKLKIPSNKQMPNGLSSLVLYNLKIGPFRVCWTLCEAKSE